MKLIERKDYLEKVINVIGTPDIKVITGVRRSGKSKLLEAFKSHVSANIETANIIHINFNLPDFDDLTEYRPLYDYINAAYKEGADNFVLIDEIQMCNNFEKAIVPAAVQIDGEQISIQQLAAAAHKRQTLFILALAGAFAYKQYFGIFNTLTEHHVGAGLAQLAACAGQTARSQSFPIHDDTISS